MGSVKHILPVLALASTIFISCHQNLLPKDNWETKTYNVLSSLISDYGSTNKNYNPECRPYAVFDFDNTTIIGDIELTVMAYQLEHLIFAINPDDIFRFMTENLGDIDKEVETDKNQALTVRKLSKDIESDYRYLYENYISKKEEKNSKIKEELFSKIIETPEYQDFKAKVWTLSAVIYQHYEYSAGCLWLIRLYNGLTIDEQKALVKEAADEAFAIKTPFIDTWTSPDMGNCGKVSIKLMRGLGISKEIKSLYKTLQNNGFDVYICSASEENILEAIACDPKYGLGHSPEYTYGVRSQETINGKIIAKYDTTYIQTYKEGKVKAIMAYMAPNHCGKEPSLVAGDSNGDYAMLTEFKDLKVGLIINCLNGGEIGELMKMAIEDKAETPLSERTSPQYVVQGRNASKRIFIPDWDTVPMEY